jgi:hypothetical protein
MENLSVNLASYQSGSGFDDNAMAQANLSSEQLAELSKALEAGSIQGGDLTGNQSSGGALKTESLESSLKLITFRESDIRFWKRFPKTAAYNTVEEYNQHTSYGTERGGFNNEGELPEEEDSQYVRKAEHVKYLGVTKSVTHPMQLVNTNVGDIVQKETTNGIMWILRKADRALFYGDEKLVTQEWNGIYAQHLNNDQFANLEEYFASNLVVDLRGAALTEANVETGAQTLLTKFAQPNLMCAPPIVFSEFAKGFYARQRIAMGGKDNANVSGAISGQHISKFQSMYGLIDFEYDIFAAKPVGKLPGGPATSPKAPAAITPAGSPAVVATSDGLSRFTDGIGDYFYAVAAVNRYGESAMTQMGTTVTIANADDVVDLTFTATAGAFTPIAYIVYRSEKNPAASYANTVLYPIMTIPATGSDVKRGSLANGVDGGAAGKVRDRNRWLPATEEAILLQGDTDVIEFKQLAPLMKMPLAKLSPADRFMVLLYGTPIIYAPSKMVRYVNIGKA